MKWYGKVALASVALMIVGFGGVKLYNTSQHVSACYYLQA